MSKQDIKAASSINPFLSLYEFASQPVDILRHFYNHSLDDFAEDSVTAVAVASYIYYMPSVSFGASIFLAVPAYYGIKRVADYTGEIVESFIKDKSESADNQESDNILIKVADDLMEDFSKSVCISWNVVKAIGVVEVSRILYNQNIAPTAVASNKWVKLADILSGSFGGMATYSECDELANAHGHWVADKLGEFFSPQSTLPGDVSVEDEL